MIARALKSLRDGLLSVSYPMNCRLCATAVESWDLGVACSLCWTDPDVTRLLGADPICVRCGAPILNRQGPLRGPPLCGYCELIPVAAARACGIYGGALEASILFLKAQPHICSKLRGILADTYNRHRASLSSDVIVPVPLHESRERERGFNQAQVIARTLSRVSGIPIDKRSISRTKHTRRHRAGMDVVDRAKSVERAFQVRRPEALRSASVLLVDDIYTTGSTLGEAAKVMLEAGARVVNAFTIARTNLPASMRPRSFITNQPAE